jgi:hypothetical protein
MVLWPTESDESRAIRPIENTRLIRAFDGAKQRSDAGEGPCVSPFADPRKANTRCFGIPLSMTDV